MTLSEAVVQERAKEFEVQESEKIIFSPEYISTLETLLLDVYAILHPKPSDYKHRTDLIQAVDELVKKTLGSGNGFPIVEAFGSFIMDMFTAKSDLDLSVNFSNVAAGFSREMKISVLKKLLKKLYALQSKDHVFGVRPILRARVPILKVVDSGTGIECDVSVENKDGIARSAILHIVSSIDERFRKLSFLMKAWAKAHGINSSKDRTLSSLSIVSLVAFHLQTRNPPILPPFSALFKDGLDIASVKNAVLSFQHFGRQNKESLAELFASMLTKLSSAEILWPFGLCASTYEGSWISKTWKPAAGHINVEDFKDRSQNVARSVGKNQVQKIHKCIHGSVKNLSSFMAGQIQAPKLRELLFGPDDSILPLNQELINNDATPLKRSFPFHGSTSQLNSVRTKKRRRLIRNDRANQAYGDAPGHVAALTNPPDPPLHPRPSVPSPANQAYGDTPGHVAALTNPPDPPLHPRPSVLSPANQAYGDTPGHVAASTNPPAPLHPRPFVPSQLGYNPVGFDGSHGPNLMLRPSVGFGGLHGPNVALRPQVAFGGSHNGLTVMLHSPVGFVGSQGPNATLHLPVGFGGSYGLNPTIRRPGGFDGSHGQNLIFRPQVGFDVSHGQNPMFRHLVGFDGSHGRNPTFRPPVEFNGSYGQTFRPPVGFDGSHSQNPTFRPPVEFNGSHGPTFRPPIGFDGSHSQNPMFRTPMGFVGSHGQNPSSHPPIGFAGSRGPIPTFRPPY